MTFSSNPWSASGSAGAGRYPSADRVVLICLPCRIGLVLGDHHNSDRSAAGNAARNCDQLSNWSAPSPT